jgi:hypothetical protein
MQYLRGWKAEAAIVFRKPSEWRRFKNMLVKSQKESNWRVSSGGA